MSNLIPVLALDLATSTGWALRSRDGSITSGVQAFDLRRGESPGMRFLRFRRWLQEVLALGQFGPAGAHPGVIACEQSIAVHRGGHAAAVAHGLQAITQTEAATLRVELTSIAPSSLKKHATGRGNAKKPDMIAAAEKRWAGTYSSPLQEDQADALCVLAWALDEIEAPARLPAVRP